MQYKIYPSPQGKGEHLILFFNGWAMTPESVEHLARPEGCDLLVLWDYRDLSLPLDLDLSPYARIDLVAWSMGVWAADHVLGDLELPIRHAVAVCGTGYPMDDLLGIPEDIFRATLEGITEDNRLRFNRRMCGGKTLRHLFDALAQRSTQEIYNELESVLLRESKGDQRPLPKAKTAPWGRAIIGQGDRIVPPANQQRYWAGQGVLTELTDDAHYAFVRMTSWDELWT